MMELKEPSEQTIFITWLVSETNLEALEDISGGKIPPSASRIHLTVEEVTRPVINSRTAGPLFTPQGPYVQLDVDGGR